MYSLHRLTLMLKAFQELGPRHMGLYAWYRTALWSGYLHRHTPPGWTLIPQSGTSAIPDDRESRFEFIPALELPQKQSLITTLGDEGLTRLKLEAQEIVGGEVRLFGGEPVPLELEFPDELFHWTEYEKDPDLWRGRDPKFVWEPGRFGWACTLARAYYMTENERYAQAFWRCTETFLEANPLNMGPQWVSAQEVALRLISLTFALGIFAGSRDTTRDRRTRLAAAIADHAERIPPTLAYARAQNNNHLLTEAVGLFTAGMCLPNRPRAKEWVNLGWRWINRALQTQIAVDGVYVQHSANYHRLMLQAAIWTQAIALSQGISFPPTTQRRLAAATDWLFSLLDEDSGRTPNLGHNDGAYILPLTVLPFYDYRPVLAAADSAFSDERRLGPGPWDEMALWLNAVIEPPEHGEESSSDSDPTVHSGSRGPAVLRSRNSWAYLRAAHFRSRPAHADQLHLDLWGRGVNVARDAGTYRYNAAPPWENPLTATQYHNSVELDGMEQMTRAGRFLYVDWAQARLVDQMRSEYESWERVIAEHDGYRNQGVIHRRTVSALRNDHWVIEDQLLKSEKRREQDRNRHRALLHWLLPDWDWDLQENGEMDATLRLLSPWGWIYLMVGAEKQPGQQLKLRHRLIRAGELLYGEGAARQTQGWYSSTYGRKEPALSLSSWLEASLPIGFRSEWMLTPDSMDHTG